MNTNKHLTFTSLRTSAESRQMFLRIRRVLGCAAGYSPLSSFRSSRACLTFTPVCADRVPPPTSSSHELLKRVGTRRTWADRGRCNDDALLLLALYEGPGASLLPRNANLHTSTQPQPPPGELALLFCPLFALPLQSPLFAAIKTGARFEPPG